MAHTTSWAVNTNSFRRDPHARAAPTDLTRSPGPSILQNRDRETVSEALGGRPALSRQNTGQSFHAVPANQVSPVRELDVAGTAAVLTKAGAIAGRHLTRQNTGLQGAHVFTQLQEVRRKTAKRAKFRCLIDPRTSKLINYWDGAICVAIVLTALLTPVEVSFLPISTSPYDPTFLINRFIDLVFLADMLISFRLVYAPAGEGDDGINWVEDPKDIALHYQRGWFPIDSVAIATSGVIP